MRIEISHKFVLGFVVVVGSIVFLDYLVPVLGFIPQSMQQFVSTLGALLVGLVFGWIFSKAFTSNIGILTTGAERLSHGDLSRTLKLRKGLVSDETEDLADSLNLVVDNLRKVVGKIRTTSVRVNESSQGLSASAEEMTATSHEVAGAIEQISRGAETQAEMVEKVSRVIRDLAGSIEQITASSQILALSSAETTKTAKDGGQLTDTALEKMKLVLSDVEGNSRQMVSFSEHVQKIGTIIDVITGIAQKTNLLALNATIEAARAGEYGQGFAVVAEEISKLADSTSASAGEITRLIDTTRDESLRVHQSMLDSVRAIDAGRGAIDSTSGVFRAIIEKAEDAQGKAHKITALTEQQNKNATEIVAAIEEISRVAEDNAAGTEQVSAATEEQSAAMEELTYASQKLAQLADELLTTVSRFNLGSDAEAPA
ncbi:MAG: methyl-accepting chemotaxis protein [Deltaproteobacteria bacterium]|nr:methyl-accepting chemotaxis protein [Deltaproteobacteria bacterium]NCP02802.1 methyl-accepting chemotaxis protein [Deltaproteobacteria bacterium]